MLRSRLSVAGLLLLVAGPAAAQGFVDHAELDDILEPTPNQMGGGVAFFDYDGDRRLDVLVTHGHRGVFLYRNGGPPDFRFRDVTGSVGLPASMNAAVGCAVADLDRDGDTDLVVADYRELRLFENLGGRFREATEDAFPAVPWSPYAVALADVDGDGWTDVYSANFSILLDWPYHECSPSTLLRNRGDGTFEDVTASSGTGDPGCTLTALFSDYDRDGDPDLVSGNDFGMFAAPNHLYRNDGLRADGTVAFSDVSLSSGMDRRLYTMGIATADVDGNGYPDYFFTSIGRGALLLGGPGGVFEDGTDAYGVGCTLGSSGWLVNWGCGFLDVTNDGLWDLYVPSGYLDAAPEIRNAVDQPNLLFVGLGAAEPAPEIARELGAGASDRGHGIATGDFDDDGDDDILTGAIGGEVHLYRNDTGAGPAVRVRLRGTVSNPDALGAWVALRCEGTFREREIVTGGSHGSAHASGVRLALAGCEDGGDLVVTWPSGLVETHEVVGGGALSLTEPEWFTVEPAWLPADGVSTSTVRVVPNGADGRALGTGHDVALATTAGSIGAVADLGDGSYEAIITAPVEPGEAALTLTIDGETLPAHPRVHFHPAGGDRTTLHASRDFFHAGGAPVRLTVVPRDAAGVPDGFGPSVSFDLVGATAIGAVVYEGWGRWGLSVRGNGGGPIVASALVDGVPRGPTVRVPEVRRIDPVRSVVRLVPGWVDADLMESSVTLFVSPRDGMGNVLDDAHLLEYELRGPEGPVVPDRTSPRAGAVGFLARASTFLENQPVTVVAGGTTLGRAVVLDVYEDGSELADAVDPSTSRMGPYVEGAYADGQDYSWVNVRLRDAEGDAIPFLDGFGFVSDEMTLVESRITMRGEEGKARMRAGREPGPAWVEVTWAGEPLGVGTWVDLFPARVRDLDRDRVRTCLAAVHEEADGAGEVLIEVTPIDDRGFLLGSNYPLRLWVDGVPSLLDYAQPGVYVGWVPVPAEPRVTTVQTELVGTGRGSTLEIEFLEPGSEPTGTRPMCANVEPGFVVPDADAGPDAGADAGGSSGDGGGPTDAGAWEAGPGFVGRAAGGGCTCRASTPARGDLGAPAPIVWLVAAAAGGWRRSRRPGAGRSRS